MRAIFKVKIDMTNRDPDGFFQTIMSDYWDFYSEEAKASRYSNLIEKVYANDRDYINSMEHLIAKHKISACECLISYGENTHEFDFRIFQDSLQTLKNTTGRLLHDLYYKSLGLGLRRIKLVNKTIEISEINQRNRFATGVLAIRKQDYIKKTFNDKRVETIFLIITFIIFVASIISMSILFQNRRNSLNYEIISKLSGPFLASTLLTLLNLILHYNKLRRHSRVIWND